MRNGIKLVLVLGVLFSSVSFADPTEKELMKTCMANAKTDCMSWAAQGGGGGGFPRGLGVETKVELASGERYILEGTIVINNSSVYLKVDLDKQPWLASRKRKTNPYYLIDDTLSRWTKYENKTLTLVVSAKAVVWMNGDRAFYEMQLDPGVQPVIDATETSYTQSSCR